METGAVANPDLARRATGEKQMSDADGHLVRQPSARGAASSL